MNWKTTAVLLAGLGVAHSAQAQIEISNHELEEKGIALTAEAGVDIKTGNTKTQGYRGRIELAQMFVGWRNDYHLEGDHKRDDGQVTDERYFASAQANRAFGEKTYGFGRGSYESDRFNGLDDATVLSVGAGYRIYDTETYFWNVEGGPGYSYNRAKDPKGNAIMRFSSKFWYQISDSSRFSQFVSVETGKSNTLSRSETALTANIVGSLAMKAAFLLTHQTKPSLNSDGSSKLHTDTRTTLTLLYTF